jgi:prolipoprotein diacylglyceryltransferase
MEFQRELVVLFDRVQIRYYGIIIVVAMLVAATVAARLTKRTGRDPDHIWGALTWAIIPAIIGARLWFILFPPAAAVDRGQNTAWYFQNFFNLENGAIAIWSGGLSIFGAVIGGFLGAYIYLRRNKQPVLPWLDIAAVALPLGQFRQPGIIRRAHHPALGHPYRRQQAHRTLPQPGRLPGIGRQRDIVSPAVPV